MQIDPLLLSPSTGFRPLWRDGPEAFKTFARQMYAYLDEMRPGRSVTFRRYEGEKLRWAIATAAAYLLEGDHWKTYQLMDDYLTIRRLPTHKWIKGDTKKKSKS